MYMNFVKIFVILCSVIFVFGCSEDNNDNKNIELVLIKPGEFIDFIHMGDTYQKILNFYGQPDQICPLYDSNLIYIFYGTLWLGCVIVDENSNTLPDPEEKVIESSAGYFYEGKTKGGNGIGSTRDHIESEFGTPDYPGSDYYYYVKIGILFSFHANRPSETCQEVMVWKPY